MNSEAFRALFLIKSRHHEFEDNGARIEAHQSSDAYHAGIGRHEF